MGLAIWSSLCTYAATTSSNATVRIPRNIRVRITGTNNTYTTVTVPMETYVARVLSHEWFSSWGDYPGGINSLAAGSAAIRSYSIAKVNFIATNSTYDICDTSSCQVYGSTSSSNADNAVSQTTGFVILGSNLAITNTEYSAENNSKTLSCGDGYTSPAVGCLFDPVCLGETRNGHGRGMCQWGSAKWATGLKMAADNSGYPASANTGTTNGYPKQTWDWIVNHYYPGHTLWQGTPLVEGDNVIVTLTSIQVHMNADGSISNETAQGMSAPLITQKSVQSTGVIITNSPNYVVVTNDGFGFTWYKIRWSDGTIGWSPENWLQRDIPPPSAPFSLAATVVSPTQVNLAWSDTNSTELGFEIQRARGTNWYTLKSVGADATNYTDTDLVPGKTYSYRIRVFNVGTNSNFSGTVFVTIPRIPPTLVAVSDQTISEGALLTFTNTATAPDLEQSLIDFESDALGVDAMFRWPTYSGSTYDFIDTTVLSNTQVTNSFPAGAAHDAQALRVWWSFTNTSNPWLRLTTTSTLAPFRKPNPVIDFTKTLKFDIYTDKALKVALGCRETTNAVGTGIGTDGGMSGTIEWVGATNKLGAGPAPNRTVTAGSWQTLSFNIPNEPTTNFTGDGILHTASGLGVLEHLAFVPAAGNGAYNVYLDNFVVTTPKTLTYSLDPGYPDGASVNPNTGVFSWTPTEAQGGGSYNITVRVTDNSTPPLSSTKAFAVTVLKTNSAPVLATITNYNIHAGSTLMFTNFATDSDIPANVLTFSMANAPAGASLDSNSGVFSWTPLDAQANTTNTITIKVTDNGTPTLSDSKDFIISVTPRPILQSTSVNGGTFTFNWSAIAGKKYRIQFKEDLSSSTWTDLTDITAGDSTVSFSESAGSAQRFYRIIDLD